MKIGILADSIPNQSLRIIRNSGSEASQVRKLMNSIERDTHLIKNMNNVVNNPESFPNTIHASSNDFVQRLLDVI